MSTGNPKSLADITQDGIRVLYRELGPVQTVRFLRQFTHGFGDYIQERDALWGGKSLDEIVGSIKRGRRRH
jgi:hypothetical protein